MPFASASAACRLLASLWISHHRARASAKSPLGEALAYIAKYRDGLGCFRRSANSVCVSPASKRACLRAAIRVR